MVVDDGQNSPIGAAADYGRHFFSRANDELPEKGKCGLNRRNAYSTVVEMGGQLRDNQRSVVGNGTSHCSRSGRAHQRRYEAPKD